MIRVVCSACGYERDYPDAMAGLSTQCANCFTFVQVPQANATAITEAPRAASGIRTAPPREHLDVANEPPTPPADIPEAQLRTWFDAWMDLGVKVQDMETKLIERGCSPRFARWYIQRALEGHIGDELRQDARALGCQLGCGVALFALAGLLLLGLAFPPPIYFTVATVTWMVAGLSSFGFGFLVRWYLATRPAD